MQLPSFFEAPWSPRGRTLRNSLQKLKSLEKKEAEFELHPSPMEDGNIFKNVTEHSAIFFKRT